MQRGDLQIAISTNGKSPALAQRLRQELETQFGPEYEGWLEWLRRCARSIAGGGSSQAQNKEVLHHLASKGMYEQICARIRIRSPRRKGVE